MTARVGGLPEVGAPLPRWVGQWLEPRFGRCQILYADARTDGTGRPATNRAPLRVDWDGSGDINVFQRKVLRPGEDVYVCLFAWMCVCVCVRVSKVMAADTS